MCFPSAANSDKCVLNLSRVFEDDDNEESKTFPRGHITRERRQCALVPLPDKAGEGSLETCGNANSLSVTALIRLIQALGLVGHTPIIMNTHTTTSRPSPDVTR